MFVIIRVHLELAVPVWHSGLTQQRSADIERVQSIAVSFILGGYQLPYDQACTMLGLKPLYIRRMELCGRFAVKTAYKSRHSDLFQQEKEGSHNTLSREDIFREYICRKNRFYNSPLPFLTRTLNQ